MTYILTLQFPTHGEEDDFEALVSMEEALIEGLGDDADVDGNDIGTGEMNIFIETDAPEKVFADSRAILEQSSRWHEVRAAYRETDGSEYTVLWPSGLGEFTVA